MSAPSRRELLQGAAALALAQLVRVTPASALPLAPRGFCPAPHGDLEQTLFALAETIVPGSRTDPSGAPGASDVCALGVLLDPQLPTGRFATVVKNLLDGQARQRFGQLFHELTYAQRVEAADGAEATLPILTLLYRLVRSAFYAAAYNEAGTRWMGFPGENLGYVDHPDFTPGVPVGEEQGDGGNLP